MALTQSPLYPDIGDTVTVSDPAISTDCQVVTLTSVPPTSALTESILALPNAATLRSVTAVAEADAALTSFVPDAPGEYGVAVYGLRRIAPRGTGETSFAIVSKTTGTVNVGARLRLPIRVGRLGADLRILVVGDTIRDADLVPEADQASRVATLDGDVVTALTNLTGDAVSSLGSLQVAADDLGSQLAAHLATTGSVHDAADVTNTLARGPAASQSDLVGYVNALRRALIGHLTGSSASSAPWHETLEDDSKNIPVANAATDLGSAAVLLADLRERAYERHRVQTSSPATHTAADTTNALSAPTALDDVIVAYLDALVAASTTAPTGEPDGAVAASLAYGFRRES